MTVAETNKHLVLRYVAALNSGGLDTLRQVFAEDAMIQCIPGQGGLAVAMPTWKETHQSFAPRLIVEEMAAEGDSVAARLAERGALQDVFREQVPTGKSYEPLAMEWFLLRDGKIQQRWTVRDAVALARQVGLTPQETSL